jgi:hypothetical protein
MWPRQFRTTTSRRHLEALRGLAALLHQRGDSAEARSVPELRRAGLRGCAIVVTENPADALTPSNRARFRVGRRTVNQRVPDSLVIALDVIMGDELTNQATKMPLAERQDAIQAFLLDRAHKAFCVRIGQRQRLQLMRTIRHEPFV